MPALAVLAAGLACQPGEAGDATPSPPGAAQMEPRIAEHLATADHVVLAQLVALGPPPSFWSGRVPAFQAVSYQVTRAVKGGLSGEISVRHPVVANAVTAASDAPGLSADFFQKGKTYVLFLRAEGAGLVCLSERDGVLEATPAVLAKLP